ncbi:unnamed protein product, partial [Coregonus sp. 'balchen']
MEGAEMSAFRRCSGVFLLGLCCVLMELWRLGAACPASCTCSGARIACVDQERGIMAFPVLQSELEMDNITDIYIANQSSFSSINDKDLHYYRNLTNLTVTNSRLTYEFERQQPVISVLEDISTFKHIKSIMWMKLWLGEEADAQELQCIAEDGGRKPLTRLKLPHCMVPMATLSPSKVMVQEGADMVLTCNTSGEPSPELIWKMTPLISYYEIEASGQVSELHLYNLSSLDNNCKITCSAGNIVGENESTVLLNILFPPNISKLSDAYQDHHWCIPFSMSGNPKPKLRWLLNGEPVNEGPYIMTMIHDFSEREYHGCLQLDSPTHINNGPYTLLASNNYGQDRKTIYVVVGVAAVAFTGFLLMLVILKFGGNSKFGIKGK